MAAVHFPTGFASSELRGLALAALFPELATMNVVAILRGTTVDAYYGCPPDPRVMAFNHLLIVEPMAIDAKV